MAGVSKIKWTDEQRKQLQREVKRFNAKITREARKSPELAEFLPQKLSARDLRQKIKTPSDLRVLKNAVNRAFERGAFTPITTKQGVKTTSFAINEIKRGVARINRQRAKERATANPSTEAGTMGSIHANNLKPKRFDPDKVKKSDWDMFVESVEKQSSAYYSQEKIEKYKQDYLNAIKTNLGEEGTKLYQLIEKLPPSYMYGKFYDDAVLQIGFISDPPPAKKIATAAYRAWMREIKADTALLKKYPALSAFEEPK